MKLLFTAFVLFGSFNSIAQTWRDIIPLKTNRDEVKKLLGKPLFDDDGIVDIFDISEGRLNVMYVRKPCEQGLPSNWGNWNVPMNTVVNITIHLKSPKQFENKDSKVSLWYTDDSGASYYRDESKGIEYSVTGDLLGDVTYGPKKSDYGLLCIKNAPEIRY